MNPGDVIGERFVIERWAGAGGMGTVYRALDRRSGSLAAIKILRRADADSIERFTREARILAELRHPGIVAYLGHGQTPDGDLYLAMEWLEGEDLGTRLASVELSHAETSAAATRAAAALAVAHARGIVHRDVKPSNLFLTDWQPARATLLDFGVARFGALPRLTASGMAVGTPLYMAPEQARGGRDVDARVDVFALGAVLYRCLSGRLPFPASSPADLQQLLFSDEDAPPLPPEVPRALAELVARMVKKEARDRPRDAGAVLGELLGLDDTVAGSSRPGRGELSSGERRVRSLLLCGAPPSPALKAAAAALGASVEPDPAGAAALVGGGRIAIDEAQLAARLALAARDLLPDAPLALVSGRDAGTADGRARAAAMLALAPDPPVRPLPTRLDEATAGLLGARFEIAGDEAGLVLLRERDPDEGARTLLGRPTPFVGRERELALLEGIHDDCVENGAARVVLVTAPAGTGKSRLRSELVARIRRRLDPGAVWLAAGDPTRAGAPYGLLGEIIRRAAGVRAGDPLPQKRALLAGRVARLLPAERAARVADFLGELAGVPFDDADNAPLRAARRDAGLLAVQTRAAFEEWLGAETAGQPVAIVLEDLHWGDLPTIKMIDAALRALAERPLFVLGLARPEVGDLFPHLWAEHGLQQLHLRTLSRAAAERLVSGALGADPDTIAAIVDRAEGNAFYLEELCRHVAGGGKGLPETVLAMALARFNAFDLETRRVLRAASIFGEVAWAGGVRALLGGAAVERGLAELVDREVLQRRVGPRFPGEQELGFRHSLLREAAYAMLTDEDRAVGHRLAAEWLAAAGEGQALVVAEHFERGADQTRASAWFGRAAEQALAGHDITATLERADRAVALGAEGEAAGALRLLQTVAHRSRGDNVQARALSLEALRLLPAGGDAWFTAAGEAVAACGKLFQLDDLRSLVGRLEEIDAGDRMSAVRAIAFARAAVQCFLDGEPELGDALRARVDPLPGHLQGDPAVAGHLRVAEGYDHFARGACDPARRVFREAAASFLAAGDERSACEHRVIASFTDGELGLYEEMEADLTETTRIAEKLGLGSLAVFGNGYRATALVALGRLDEAEAVLHHAGHVFRDATLPRVLVAHHDAHGALAWARGDLAEAERHLRLAVGQGLAAIPPIIRVQGHLASVLCARGDGEGAWAIASQAVGLLRGTRFVPHEAEARLALAEAARLLGRDDAPALAAKARERLQAWADLIEDPAVRASFFERVPSHRKILAL